MGKTRDQSHKEIVKKNYKEYSMPIIGLWQTKPYISNEQKKLIIVLGILIANDYNYKSGMNSKSCKCITDIKLTLIEVICILVSYLKNLLSRKN